MSAHPASGTNASGRDAPSHPGAARNATTRGHAMTVIALCGVALLARVLFAARSGFWRDEGQLLWIVRMPTAGAMLDFVRHHESHPPLFFLLMRGVFAVFGRSDAAALAPAILFGVAQVPLAYVAGRRMFGARTGLIAAVLLALSTPLILFSSAVRPYSLLPLLCLASAFLLWRGLLQGGLRVWALYVATTLAMLLVHNWAWLVWGAEWAAVGAWFLGRRTAVPRIGLGRWALAQVAIGFGYAPWLPTMLDQVRHAGHGPGPPSLLAGPLQSVLEATLSLPAWGAAALLAGLLGTALWRRIRRPGADDSRMAPERRLALWLTIGIPAGAVLAAVALNSRTNLIQNRCLVTLTPCTVLAVSYGIARLSPPQRALRSMLATAALAALYLAETVVFSGKVKSNARELAAAVARQARPDDLIVIAPEWLAASFNYYYAPDNPQIDFPQLGREGASPFDDSWTRMADPAAMARVRQRLIEAHVQGRRVWLVMERRSIVDDVPARDTLLAGPGPVAISFPAVVRANQVRKLLVSLYGPPDTSAVPPDRRSGSEIMSALLFERRPATRESRR